MLKKWVFLKGLHILAWREIFLAALLVKGFALKRFLANFWLYAETCFRKQEVNQTL